MIAFLLVNDIDPAHKLNEILEALRSQLNEIKQHIRAIANQYEASQNAERFT
jgi:hypothetical protein